MSRLNQAHHSHFEMPSTNTPSFQHIRQTHLGTQAHYRGTALWTEAHTDAIMTFCVSFFTLTVFRHILRTHLRVQANRDALLVFFTLFRTHVLSGRHVRSSWHGKQTHTTLTCPATHTHCRHTKQVTGNQDSYSSQTHSWLTCTAANTLLPTTTSLRRRNGGGGI